MLEDMPPCKGTEDILQEKENKVRVPSCCVYLTDFMCAVRVRRGSLFRQTADG